MRGSKFRFEKTFTSVVVRGATPKEVVIPREGGVSSVPRLLDVTANVSGILDHPLSRMMTAVGMPDSISTFARVQTHLRNLAACARVLPGTF
jgi:hypothetical protein